MESSRHRVLKGLNLDDKSVPIYHGSTSFFNRLNRPFPIPIESSLVLDPAIIQLRIQTRLHTYGMIVTSSQIRLIIG
ncbi:unnamed protein product [Clonostachys rhizophaga]|uniref:Uncharacterized protein n=1 Tax=Clonostachys rhizophaga TaxID=160324 RepID=A0A9N9VQP8_9HYPO|nr:unnamed protein product [Clonostachys rhizophaga]